MAGLGGGSTILLFVGGLRSSSTRDTAADAFLLAVEMLKGGNKKVQVCARTRVYVRTCVCGEGGEVAIRRG